MNVNSAQGDAIETLLRQMGAYDIVKVRGLLYFMKFKLNDKFEISYSYNINAKKQYFLQRIKPYPIPQGVFSDEYEVVSFITKDLKKFNNAMNSSNFSLFLDVTKKVNSITSKMEDLFLNYNVDKNEFLRLNKELDDIVNEINFSKDKSKRL
ncbi:hypothetical protein [Romboutsia lituseburensis]|uniref:Uncharacterized protein n=1 Tax=Romboutsia lituseburensis DSM 797 TaxID=1121325 RepID=A0A1G9L021_9FIRM|nr:hypothetical protein [Romboutsia lituseburensis]CEH35095.1 Hypothetical protein RLITU_2516 [Romboutsia lituseburensis]SDL55328.1 hypothetical protein SAMN04515677_102330 [Romboutsia lituseburensis DSM 797]